MLTINTMGLKEKKCKYLYKYSTTFLSYHNVIPSDIPNCPLLEGLDVYYVRL